MGGGLECGWGSRFCPAVVFVVGVGWQYGPGASGGSLGVGFPGGFGAGAAALAGWGIGDS